VSDDTKLSGMLDGELGPKEQAAMLAQMANDATLKAKIAELEENDDLVRAAFNGPLNEHVPERFVTAIDAGLARQEPSNPDNVVRLDPPPQHAINDNGFSRWRLGGALAASLAVGVVLGTQWMAPDNANMMSKSLSTALDTTPSAQSAEIAQGQSVTPLLSFAKVGGGYCRQFNMTGKSGVKTGVACRADQGWSIEALLPRTETASAEIGYVAAEGSGNVSIDSAIASLRAGDPLDQAAEAELIAQGWK
jgi:surface antigen